jgi:hypothetical protein
MTDDPFRCICDPDDLFDPPDRRPYAVEGCPAHQARRAAQQYAIRHDPRIAAVHQARLAESKES